MIWKSSFWSVIVWYSTPKIEGLRVLFLEWFPLSDSYYAFRASLSRDCCYIACISILTGTYSVLFLFYPNDCVLNEVVSVFMPLQLGPLSSACPAGFFLRHCHLGSLKNHRCHPCWCGSFGCALPLCTKRLPAWFPFRVHHRVTGSVPSKRVCRRQSMGESLSLLFLSLSPPLWNQGKKYIYSLKKQNKQTWSLFMLKQE